MKFSVEEKIKELIKQALEKAGIFYEGGIGLEHPGEEGHGDYATNLPMQIFRECKTKLKVQNFNNPRELAELIIKNFPKSDLIEKVEAAGQGFINFFLAPKYLLDQAGEILDTGGEYGQNEMMKEKKFMVEFAHPNTHKMFHIGHLRNATTGECLVRILEANGAKIIRANYEGDVGMHIAKCLYSIMQKSKNSSVILGNPAKQGDSGIKRDSDSGQARMTINDLENQYKTIKERVEFLGKMYAEGNKAYEEDEKAKKEILEINKKIYAKDPEVYDLWKVTRQWSLSYFETIYKRIYTHFDRYYFESECYEHGKELVMEGLKRSVFEESEGAIIFPGEKFGTHTRVFITKEGNTTYEGKDMALGELQFKEHTPDLIIHVVGPEQADYFKVIFEALGQLFSGMKEKEKHVPYGWVKLKKGKMSSREGNVVLGEWLLDEAKERVKKIMEGVERTQEKNLETQSIASLQDNVAEKVAVGAVKYSFLKVSLPSEIAFDIDESINFEGDSGPYLQYTYARTRSVMRKTIDVIARIPIKSGDEAIPNGIATPHFVGLAMTNDLKPEELSLLRWLYRFPEVVLEAGRNYSPNMICAFLFELAQRYNLFYNKLPILKAESDERRNFRLMLNEAVGIVLKNGLNLLGIEAVEKM